MCLLFRSSNEVAQREVCFSVQVKIKKGFTFYRKKGLNSVTLVILKMSNSFTEPKAYKQTNKL